MINPKENYVDIFLHSDLEDLKRYKFDLESNFVSLEDKRELYIKKISASDRFGNMGVFCDENCLAIFDLENLRQYSKIIHPLTKNIKSINFCHFDNEKLHLLVTGCLNVYSKNKNLYRFHNYNTNGFDLTYVLKSISPYDKSIEEIVQNMNKIQINSVNIFLILIKRLKRRRVTHL